LSGCQKYIFGRSDTIQQLKPSDYKNIIFDFGGVILNLDYQRTIDAFRQLGVKDFDQSYSQLNQTELFDRFEQGETSSSIFRDGLRQAFGKPVSDEKIDIAWNAMLLDLPSERLEVLERLHSKKRLSLLSNTNEIHVQAFESNFKEIHGFDDLTGFFDQVYYSCRMGMRKPERRIFDFVIKEQKYIPSETLFIDDSPQHVEAARNAGLNAYHLRADQGETILDLF
jgi:putative hydrolase of the HAD superfamily